MLMIRYIYIIPIAQKDACAFSCLSMLRPCHWMYVNASFTEK